MEFPNLGYSLWLLLLLYNCDTVKAEESCYGAGSIATSVVISVISTLIIIGVVIWWIKRRTHTDHLILETDPEKGAADYSYDNPGFKESGLTPISKSLVKPTNEFVPEQSEKQQWNYWPALSGPTVKTGQRRILDDSVLNGKEIKVVALKSHDFTGLGFNICGNMKDGIYIRDISHRGPASESGMLNQGDRINSITISFEHIVYEDALNILSYASPYEIIIEAKSDGNHPCLFPKSNHPVHPIYRSSSSMDVHQVERSTRKQLNSDNFSSLNKLIPQKTMGTMIDSSFSDITQIPIRGSFQKNSLISEDLRQQLEQKIIPKRSELNIKSGSLETKVDIQGGEEQLRKFGVKVLPVVQKKVSKIAESSQNENNINIERKNTYNVLGETAVSEAGDTITRIEYSENSVYEFERNGSLSGSGLKRDSLGIPQEIPTHMLNAAVAARRNRKSLDEIVMGDEDVKTNKRVKGKAPRPPAEDRDKENIDFMLHSKAESSSRDSEQIEKKGITSFDIQQFSGVDKHNLVKDNYLKEYNSASDDETGDYSSLNIIELTSSHITVHQEVNDEQRNRKTASTGDLSKIYKNRESNSGTLERAKSLDVTDSGNIILTKNGTNRNIEDTVGSESDECNSDNITVHKDTRLNTILDGLNTFQRNRLKKSTEWGNLEDVILRSSYDDDKISPVLYKNNSEDNVSFNYNKGTHELGAVVDKINEIRSEYQECKYPHSKASEPVFAKNVVMSDEKLDHSKNQIWPTDIEVSHEISVTPLNELKSIITPSTQPSSLKPKSHIQNEIWPKELDSSQDNDHPFHSEHTPRTALHIRKGEFNENSMKLQSIIDSNKQKFTGGDAEHNQRIIEITKFVDSENKSHRKENIQINTVSSSQIDQKGSQTVDIQNSPTETVPSGNINESYTPPDAIISISEKVDTSHSKFNESNDYQPKLHSNTNHMLSNIKAIEVTYNKMLESPEKTKIHKRQQLPCAEKESLPPPHSDESILVTDSSELENNRSPLQEPDDGMGIHKFSHFKPLFAIRSKSPNAVLSEINNTDESKTSNWNDGKSRFMNDTKSFILNERHLSSSEGPYRVSHEDINIPDDIKVSRHSVGSSEILKSDDLKSLESLKYSSNVSNITVNSVPTENSLHSLEFSVNEPSEEINSSEISDKSELYTTASNRTVTSDEDKNTITISTPDLIKNVTITEAINRLNSDINQSSEMIVEVGNKEQTICLENNFSKRPIKDDNSLSNDNTFIGGLSKNHSKFTYVTEIQVTPNNGNANISDIDIQPSLSMETEQYPENLKNDYQDYLKIFKLKTFQENEGVEVENEEPKYNDNILRTNVDPEKELTKIQEIVQEQLKKLPEMKFSTSSYENPTRKTEKKQSQIELLKSNFEKSSFKPSKTDMFSKSRIPVSTMKTPPTSPERRDSRNLDMDNEKEILELMSASIHSTPMTNSLKYQNSPNKNISVTSIKNSSKIPTGLPILGSGRPPIPPRKPDQENHAIPEASPNNSNFNSFKQWVFDSKDSVTNISLSGQKL